MVCVATFAAFSEIQVAVNAMAGIVQAHRIALALGEDGLDGEVHDFRNGDAVHFAFNPKIYGHLSDANEVGGQRPPPLRRAAHLP